MYNVRNKSFTGANQLAQRLLALRVTTLTVDNQKSVKKLFKVLLVIVQYHVDIQN